MEHFRVVLLILVIFAVFICLNNSGYFDRINEPFIVEGIPPAEPVTGERLNVEELQSIGECQVLDPPDQQCRDDGTCLEDPDATFSRASGSSWDRQSCTGETGNNLSWVNYLDKKTR